MSTRAISARTSLPVPALSQAEASKPETANNLFHQIATHSHPVTSLCTPPAAPICAMPTLTLSIRPCAQRPDPKALIGTLTLTVWRTPGSCQHAASGFHERPALRSHSDASLARGCASASRTCCPTFQQPSAHAASHTLELTTHRLTAGCPQRAACCERRRQSPRHWPAALPSAAQPGCLLHATACPGRSPAQAPP